MTDGQYTTHSIQADATHTLAVAEYGNPQGIPVVFLHGGPGSGCRIAMLSALFDPERFRVIAPDQRGAGNSTPKGSLENNTTQHLIADLELIREQLSIPRWLVVGGSWGALLAIAYAQAHPEQVTGIAIRSFFFGDTAAMQRAFIEIPQRLYPDLYEQFVAYLNADEQADPLQAYYRRLLSFDAAVYTPAAYVWHDYERALSVLKPEELTLPVATQDKRPLPNTPRMEAHYFSNESFLKPGELIANAGKLGGIKGVIVQGRYDLLCPPCASHELLRHWPDGELHMVDAAGHSQSEPGIKNALVRAITRIAGT